MLCNCCNIRAQLCASICFEITPFYAADASDVDFTIGFKMEMTPLAVLIPPAES